MNKEEQNEINRYLTEEVLGEHFCKPMLRSPERCSCGSFMVDTPPVSLSNPNAFTDDGDAWEFVQRVLAKAKVPRDAVARQWFHDLQIDSCGEASPMNDYDPDAICADMLTANPEAIANAIYKTLKEKTNAENPND